MDLAGILAILLNGYAQLGSFEADAERVKSIFERLQEAAAKGDVARVTKAIARLRAVLEKRLEVLRDVLDILGAIQLPTPAPATTTGAS